MHVSILVPKGQVVVSSLMGAFKIFNTSNGFLMQTGQRTDEKFQIDMVGLDHEETYYNGMVSFRASKTIDEVEKTDLIIVTTVAGDMEEAITKNERFFEWIRHQRVQHNAEVASLCTGAVLLAESGLLNGKSAATHWVIHDQFRERYPEVHLQADKIITEDNGIYTSGGAYSFLNLLLYLAEKYAGRETAIWCSKLFEIEFDRDNQNQFVVFQGQKDHADDAIKGAQEYIEKNVKNRISVEELADQFAISRRNFVRRFKKATANTPLQYIQRVKIEVAKQRLESSTQNVNEVMFEVGYNDEKAFRTLFRRFTGLTPHEYRMKYNREMAMAQL